MPWKDGYTISDEKGLRDDELDWPEKHRCAVMVVVDFSVHSGPDGIGPDDVWRRCGDLGAREGTTRLFELFENYGLRATFAVPGIMAEMYPERVKEMVRRGHEVAAHGYRHEDVTTLTLEEENRRVGLTTEILSDVCGKRPVGWYFLPRQGDRYPGVPLSSKSIDFLIDAEYEYLGNGMADDLPHYWVTDFASKRNILTLPYYYHFDDLYFLMFPAQGTATGLENPMSLYRNWTNELEASYRRGRQFTIVVHPYLIALGGHLEILENILIQIRNLPLVWNPTGNECAQYWKSRYPASSFLKLKESIWKDYPGSLS
ncbi:MAG: polysaccharide deacetylase family protein [Betaproteobacteria bacterium]|nr:polysaccharide deacetylase family protein [Betaproteobacteria bacterium]